MAKQAWGQNAVITRDEGSYVRFKPRCPRCGYVPVNRESAGSAMEGTRAYYTDRCDKCGERFDIIISRG